MRVHDRAQNSSLSHSSSYLNQSRTEQYIYLSCLWQGLWAAVPQITAVCAQTAMLFDTRAELVTSQNWATSENVFKKQVFFVFFVEERFQTWQPEMLFALNKCLWKRSYRDFMDEIQSRSCSAWMKAAQK